MSIHLTETMWIYVIGNKIHLSVPTYQFWSGSDNEMMVIWQTAVELVMISMPGSNENSVAWLLPYGAGTFWFYTESHIISFTYLTGSEMAVMRTFQMQRVQKEKRKPGRQACLLTCIFSRLILNRSSTALP